MKFGNKGSNITDEGFEHICNVILDRIRGLEELVITCRKVKLSTHGMDVLQNVLNEIHTSKYYKVTLPSGKKLGKPLTKHKHFRWEVL